MRSLLRERDDESIRLRESIERLSKSNMTLMTQVQQNSSERDKILEEIRIREKEILELKATISGNNQHKGQLYTRIQQLENRVERQKNPILSQVLELIDRSPPKPNPEPFKIWVFAGVDRIETSKLS